MSEQEAIAEAMGEIRKVALEMQAGEMLAEHSADRQWLRALADILHSAADRLEATSAKCLPDEIAEDKYIAGLERRYREAGIPLPPEPDRLTSAGAGPSYAVLTELAEAYDAAVELDRDYTAMVDGQPPPVYSERYERWAASGTVEWRAYWQESAKVVQRLRQAHKAWAAARARLTAAGQEGEG